MQSAQASLLSGGQRLHLHHGPIDLIVEAVGAERDAAYQRATMRFNSVLQELVSELPELRARGRPNRCFNGPIARRMQTAIEPYCHQFVTPMAAVAGAVADDILEQLCDEAEIHKAYVNNGGDIAFHLTPESHMTVALASVPGGRATFQASDACRGIATSGWRGRSQSLGIADAVTVVARNAACADVAATLIANAVDLPDCPAIARVPACEVFPDSDLGDRLITSDVGALSDDEIQQALLRGASFAQDLLDRQLIGAACIQLCDEIEEVGSLATGQNVSYQPSAHSIGSVVDARI